MFNSYEERGTVFKREVMRIGEGEPGRRGDGEMGRRGEGGN
jgi:hypothetical protein